MPTEAMQTARTVAVHLTGLLLATVLFVGVTTLFGHRRVLPALFGVAVLLTALAAAAASILSLLQLLGVSLL